MKYLFSVFVLWTAIGGSPVDAQFGRIIKEGAEEIGKRALSKSASKAAQEGAEHALKKAASTALREAAEESAETLAKVAGRTVLHHADIAMKAVSTHGSAIATPLIKSFGDDGAKALVKLSPTHARRMAMLGDELAASGRGGDWMRVLADKGDVAADWIWKNKGTIFVATSATAFLSNPDVFLTTGEHVAVKAVEATAEHVARPLIQDAVAKPALAVAEAAGSQLWLLAPLAMGGAFLAYRYARSRVKQQS